MKFETMLNDNNQVMIPSDFVKEYNLECDDIVEWTKNATGEIVVKFRKNNIQ